MERGTRYYHCLLCGACQITSQHTLDEHVRGRRHQRRYKILQQQQRSWFLDQLVPADFVKEHEKERRDYEDPSLLSYIMPFRKWRRNLCWTAGMTCQLCGTADMASRFDVAHHCLTSQRHATYRSNTKYLGEHHSELKRLEPRVQTLPKRYEWEFERHMIAYVGSKEAAFAGLESQAWEWYHLLHTLEVYELRANLIFLELAIWKASMIIRTTGDDAEEDAHDDRDDHKQAQRRSSGTSSFLASSSSFREERRTTCGSTVILQNVFAYLQTLPRLENELGW
jgi:hypothetical protein